MSVATVTPAAESEAKQAKNNRKAKLAAKIAEMKAKREAADTLNAEQCVSLKESTALQSDAVDEMIAAIGEVMTPARILSALGDAAFCERSSGFNLFRLRCAYVQSLILARRLESAELVDTDDKKRSAKIRKAIEAAKIEAAEKLGIVARMKAKQVESADSKKLRKQAAQQAARFASLSAVMLRWGWLRSQAELSHRPYSGMLLATFSQFARFNSSTASYDIVHPLRAADKESAKKKNGKPELLTSEEEKKIRDILTAYANGSSSLAEIEEALRVAGFRAAKKRSVEKKVGGKASGVSAPTMPSFEALGSNASFEEASKFIVAWFDRFAKSDKASAVKMVALVTKTAIENGIGQKQ
jgi:hypothetical protein